MSGEIDGLRRFDVHHVIQTRIGLFHQFAELWPFLAELRRVMRGGELVGAGPLHVIDDVAAVLAPGAGSPKRNPAASP